jgi:exonuclease VII large subunit
MVRFMAEITKEEIRERLGNIDQIRDIIFGAHLREFGGRFEKLESDLSNLQQEMRDRDEDIKEFFSTELRLTVEAIEKKLKVFINSTQEETSDLRLQSDRLNKKVSTNLQELDDEVDQLRQAAREEIGQTREKLQDEVKNLKTNVFEELERQFTMLKTVKVSKEDMAEILFELGMRLRGSEFVPELVEAAEEKYTTLSGEKVDDKSEEKPQTSSRPIIGRERLGRSSL